ncbi:hypothetical protein GH714_027024 [Hevea brasiliensis]|uniref:RRM domain-containing protein n=1 Tax=Hevea brasiliensis TaxID=3981 RepID=A0A6A6MHI5_HEVBR|nr:hypothetical protein GH714_027024 [Hevea brasiliensis]
MRSQNLWCQQRRKNAPGHMRPIFCGNFEYDARQSELERLFRRYGRVERVDMKSGFAFIYMEEERDAEDAIRGLDRIEFGPKGRRLRVEWTKQERGIRRPGNSRRSANTRPSKTLFVINFDPHQYKDKGLGEHFDPYGRIVSVRIRRNFAFVHYESQEDATKALDATNMSKLMDRVISVEYAVRDDDERRNGYSPERGRNRSPDRRAMIRGGHQVLTKGKEEAPTMAVALALEKRASPDCGRGSSRSPYRKERAGHDHGHGPSRSPYRKERVTPDNGHTHSDSPYQRERPSLESGRDRSRSPYGRERANADNGRGSSHSPYERGGASPDNGRCASPISLPEERDGPNGEAESPMHERYHSRSPPADE